MSFSPIAIVGRACVLPGALTPEALWTAVADGRDLIETAPVGRWRLGSDSILCGPDDDPTDRTWTDRGGYVRGFESVWDPQGFAIPASSLTGLDPLFLWVLHCARAALLDAGDGRRGEICRPRVQAVLGNLSFPSAMMNRYAESVWQAAPSSSDDRPDPRNRFMSSGPAVVLEQALGLAPGAFCLDGACASSLYALAVACDRLHDGVADLVLAGAVNRADDLFLHVGFCALQALSRTGQSRPFHAQADGLLPAEGAAMVALKRLADARRDDDPIYGVIRGVGLSNDGCGRGFLAPSEEGQTRAIRAAYHGAGLEPSAISLLECHATGTVLGDATELRSSAAVFHGSRDLPIGSLKSNLGHLITAAGVAGLIKILEAFRHGERPATLHVQRPTPALNATPFRVLTRHESWPADRPRLAGLSAFGFGGNNAHLIVGEPDPTLDAPTHFTPPPRTPLAVIGVGAIVGSAPDAGTFAQRLRDGESMVRAAHPDGLPAGARTDSVSLSLAGLRFPPRDLKQTLAQQLLMLNVAREATASLHALPRERTGVYVAMEADPEVCRYGLRWRLGPRLERSEAAKVESTPAGITKDSLAPPLGAEGVVGTMPNIPANRLNRQLDLGGASWTVSAGEISGRIALELAARALFAGDLDAVVVGGVDLSCQPVHTAALEAIEGRDEPPPGDAAVAVVLRRLDEAIDEADPILAVVELEDGHPNPADSPANPDPFNLRPRLGRCWAAGDLRDFVAAVLMQPAEGEGDAIRLPPRPGGPTLRVRSDPAPHRSPPFRSLRLDRFAAKTVAALEARLADDRPGGTGPCRAAIVADHDDQRQAGRQRALAHLRSGSALGPGVFVQSAPTSGEIAFVFAGAGAAYARMGRPLMRALPGLDTELRQHCPKLAYHFDKPWASPSPTPPLQRLWSSSYLCQVHAQLTQSRLGILPHAVIGYSSGESNALFATKIWSDHDAMIEQCRASGIFTEQIGGSLRAITQAWGVDATWETWTVLGPMVDLIAAVESEPRVHVSIIHHDREGVVAGEARGCARIRDRLASAYQWNRLHYDLAVHVPELRTIADSWRRLHRRPTASIRPGLRVYSGALGRAYQPSESACAEAILSQAEQRLDFRAVIEQAYADGVRVFIEHGPQGSCTRWIRTILGDRPALAVSLDRKGAGLAALLETLGALWCAQIPWRTEPGLERFLGADTADVPSPRLEQSFATRPQPLRIPLASITTAPTTPSAPEPGSLQPMPEAPPLPPVDSVPPTARSVPPPVPVPLTNQAQRSAAAPTVVSPHSPSLIEALRMQLTEVGDRQQAFVAQQTALHRDFLALQTRSTQAFIHAVQAPWATVTPMETPRSSAHPARANHRPPPALDRLEPPPQPPAAPNTGHVPPSPTPAVPNTGHVPPSPTPATSTDPTVPPAPRGLTFDRAALETHAQGAISEIYGPAFAAQDHWARQVRMPGPPLLLADRVTGLDAEPMSMKQGTIWTETDVTEGAWYLHTGRMPPGLMIESGQADLMLISYLGVDAENRGERVYRLLGCTLTYHGSPPQIAETLCFDIHLDGHAKQGDTRLMFFHYDCRIDQRLRLSVRDGQAGFFTDRELAQSEGCLWRPQDQAIVPQPRLDPPQIDVARSFDAAQVQAFADGRPWDCFGDAARPTRSHTRTPRIPGGRMRLFDHIEQFDPDGGPWKRGYLRAERAMDPNDWFFGGHFLNDPCMPGTLMFDGCLQAMAFYLAAMGYTLSRDGWRFEPIPDQPMRLSCRGQVTPGARRLSYEVFVEEVTSGPIPLIYADLLCTVDGLKAFHARRVGLRLVPAWPLDEGHPQLERMVADPPHGAIAQVEDFTFGYHSMLACAQGRPTEAFGPMYARFDGAEPVARLPSPPYHFISRATGVEGQPGIMKLGAAVDMEFDIDPSAWYFADNGSRTMPFAVLLEAALQPCGWLASYMGCALSSEQVLKFRNLDGRGTLTGEIRPDDKVLSTTVRNTQLSATASMIIVGFEVECRVGPRPVYTMSTVFGFFPAAAFEDQAGLTVAPAQHALFQAPAHHPPHPIEAGVVGRPRLAAPMLMMLDRVVYFDPNGGERGLGSARAEKDIDPGEWFFAAHFFQDPVQPGSLGIEAMLQLLQWCMRQLELDSGIDSPRFVPLQLGQAIEWKYRGQVTPTNRQVCTTMEITERGHDTQGGYARADAWLWVDGKPIYQATGIGMRIVSGPADYGRTLSIDHRSCPWLADHRPTWTVAVVPMMSIAEMLVGSARADERVIGLRNLRVNEWLVVPPEQSLPLRLVREGDEVRLILEAQPGPPREIAKASLRRGHYGDRPAAYPPLEGPTCPLPYADGSVFHGPAFQLMEQLVRTSEGASCTIRVDGPVPLGRLAPAVLDAATHGIPHDALGQWDRSMPSDQVAYPAWIPQLDLYGPTPTEGTLRCEVRYRGPVGRTDFPSFEIQLIGADGVWCHLVLVEACFPTGRLGRAAAPDRRAFLRDRTPIPGLSISRQSDGATFLAPDDVAAHNWLPGTVATVYGTEDTEAIAQAEHIAAAHRLHPYRIRDTLALTRWSLRVTHQGPDVVVRGDGFGQSDYHRVREFWRDWLGRSHWPIEDLYFGLLKRFVRRVVITDPTALAAIKGHSALYLANHQVGIESLLFSIVASALGERPTVTLAKQEHHNSWLGRLISHSFAYPDVRDPGLITFFDRNDPASLAATMARLEHRMQHERRSMMVHVEGTRSLSCATAVQALSGTFIDLALRAQTPVIPVRFCGGLPREPLTDRLEFPLGMGQQDIWIGRPLMPQTLAVATYGERRHMVLDAINGLGPDHHDELPLDGDPAFAEAVLRWQQRRGVAHPYATLYCVLAEQREACEQTRALLQAPDAAALADDPSKSGPWLHQLARWLIGSS